MRAKLYNLYFLLSLGLFSGCSQGPVAWWKSVETKAKHFSELEASHLALREEHERLKQNYYRLENEFLELKADVDGNEKGDRNLRATGSVEGRTLTSISYSPPKNLRSEESLALAYEHFKEKRFAEAAATFEDFLKKPESAALVDANAMYTAGVAWFQLGNFLKAREHFQGARQEAAGEQRERIHKKVDLWMRAIDKHAALSPDKHASFSPEVHSALLPNKHIPTASEDRSPASGEHAMPEAHKVYHEVPETPEHEPPHGGKLGD